MKKAIIILAILLFAGTAYGDTATVLKGTKAHIISCFFDDNQRSPPDPYPSMPSINNYSTDSKNPQQVPK